MNKYLVNMCNKDQDLSNKTMSNQYTILASPEREGCSNLVSLLSLNPTWAPGVERA